MMLRWPPNSDSSLTHVFFSYNQHSVHSKSHYLRHTTSHYLLHSPQSQPPDCSAYFYSGSHGLFPTCPPDPDPSTQNPPVASITLGAKAKESPFYLAPAAFLPSPSSGEPGLLAPPHMPGGLPSLASQVTVQLLHLPFLAAFLAELFIALSSVQRGTFIEVRTLVCSVHYCIPAPGMAPGTKTCSAAMWNK